MHAFRGKEFIEYDNPFDVGMTGLLGFSSGDHAMMTYDTLLMIATDFPYRQFLPRTQQSSRSMFEASNWGGAAKLIMALLVTQRPRYERCCQGWSRISTKRI